MVRRPVTLVVRNTTLVQTLAPHCPVFQVDTSIALNMGLPYSCTLHDERNADNRHRRLCHTRTAVANKALNPTCQRRLAAEKISGSCHFSFRGLACRSPHEST